MGSFGVYIHYPWCRHRCSYCDFPIAVSKSGAIPHSEYTAAVVAELAERAPEFAGLTLATIYIGGGTPSLWPADEIARVIAAVRGTFDGVPAEVTLEANPTDCRQPTMAAWLRAGVTRLSIGVQSFAGEVLHTLRRDHSMGHGEAALDGALAAGFDSISADLILAVPGAVPGLDVDSMLGYRPPHLSIYELTYEDRAPLRRRAQRGEITPENDEVVAQLYERAHHVLVAAGYEHYEVSNYARPNHRSRHNAMYWAGASYLGLGTGAASLLRLADGAGRRWRNHKSAKRYLASAPGAWTEDVEDIDADEMARDLTWLGLRTREGVAESWLRHRPELVSWLQAGGLAVVENRRIVPTLRGFLHSDAVARRVVAGWR